MKKIFVFLAVLIFISSLSNSSHALVISIDFTGSIYSVGTSISGDGVNVGDSVTGHFLYDTNALDSNLADTNNGNYEALGFDIMFGLGFSAISSNTAVRVQNDQQNGSATLPADGLTVRANTVTGDTLNGRNINAFQFGLLRDNIVSHLWLDDLLPDATDWAGVALADINKPDWHWMQFDMISDNSIFDSQIRWDINSFAITSVPVPEPSTIFLLGIGLLGLARIGRKKR